ncbi:MAG: SH3 domain-containing protein [Anaerolineae bacterium]|nr:SH3 domain-containing protein [Anaerolineae bacterium]
MKMKWVLLAITSIVMLFSNQVAVKADGPTACYQPPRLSAGYYARITSDTNIPNRMRSQPSLNNNVVGRIPAGAQVYVIEGPRCNEGMHWWRVSYNNQVGWTAEGNGWNQYWIEPISSSPNPQPTVCALQPRLTVGGQGRVTPGLPNVIRTAPGTTSSGAVNSVVIGEIPGGGIFNVLNGPQCGLDGRWWWLVEYAGIQGWTPEGEGTNTYWTEPVGISGPTCYGFMPSRLYAGGLGRVTLYPNLPNRVRTGPDYDADVLGMIPAGGSFYVISGPYCNDNTAWWQVAYNNQLVGWTAEGSGNTYWLEPSS